MSQSKLYSALLKTQSQRELWRESGAAAEQEGNHEPEIRQYGPSMDTLTAYAVPNSHSPTLYDASAAMGLINNPRPWSKSDLKARKIIYPSMSNKAILNAYREVRIKLRNLSGNSNFSVMLSSLSTKMEGKENILLPSFNLAASFAIDAQSSALLVDCNPYSRDLQKLVSVKMGHGVTDFLDDPKISTSEIIYPSGIDRLSVVPAGNIEISAVELFSSRRMKKLMEELSERYPDRYIVINAPPFRISTEARILVRFADHAIMTVPFGELTSEDVLAAIDTLDTDKFAGVMYQE